MKYGLLTYSETGKWFNIGDYVQSLAARQFLPRVDVLLNREELAKYQGEPIKLIMNGWFTHNIHNWIPSEAIRPLFISFHVNSTAAPFVLSPSATAYLKAHEPIGCRDEYTVHLLKERGVNAYMSGCLTLTLDGYAVSEEEKSGEYVIVDPLSNYPHLPELLANWKVLGRAIIGGRILQVGKSTRYMKRLISDELRKRARFETHWFPAGQFTDSQKFELAERLLKFYARAKLVITSRIHCALPCLAMNTPVLFINSFSSVADTCRFGGITELFNSVNLDRRGHYHANFDLPGRIDVSTRVTNPGRDKLMAARLKERCRAFIGEKDSSEHLSPIKEQTGLFQG